MELSENPEYLRRLRGAVSDFRDAFADLMKLCVSSGMPLGLAPYVLPSDRVSDHEVRGAQERVAVAAGRARKAPSLTKAYIAVEGRGVIDPIANWQSVMQPKPVLSPDDVTGTANAMLGRLDAMIDEAETLAPPPTGVANMHPLIWGAACPLWKDGHFRQAVSTAAEELVSNVKGRVGRRDVPETSLWQQAFSASLPQDDWPRLRWPGDALDRDVRTMNDGLRQFAPGVQMTVRNTAAHGGEQLEPQEALEMLATLSLLARWVDQCELVVKTPEAQ